MKAVDNARAVDRGASPAAAAATAAEALRALNHLTIAAPTVGTPGWEVVGDLYRVLGELRLVVERLPQALGQLAVGLGCAGDRCGYRADAATESTAEELLATACAALHASQDGARRLGAELDIAHSAIGHLYQ
jgi:hypothetical protein